MKTFYWIVGIVVALFLGFFAFNSYIYQQKQGSGEPSEPYQATLSGTYLCLPHKDTSGPQTLECALGLKADDGTYYALDFQFASTTFPNIPTGAHISVTGTVTPVARLSTNQWQQYPIEGILSVAGEVTIGQGARDATFTIEGKQVMLENGIEHQEPAAPGSASMITTQYFGNEVTGDFNRDGMEDSAFILTQTTGGSGTFYYLVAALKTASGYQGTNAIFLGDRIAPQGTEFKEGMILANYADRKPNEPMTATPSVGVSREFAIKDGKLIEIETGI